MKPIYIIDSLRTPLGSFGGALSTVPAPELAAGVIRALLEKSSLRPETVDEVIVGQVLMGGSGQAPARQAMRLAGLADGTPAMTVNKVCGSGLKAVMLAAGSIALGDATLVAAGGMENMSMSPYALPKARYGYRMGNGEMIDLLLHDALRDPYSGHHMGEVTEAVIDRHDLGRAAQDEYALRSYRLAQRAVEEDMFAVEIAPVTVVSRRVETVVDRDEEPFRVDFDKLPQLKPVFRSEGSITAGNASTINDGAAMTLVAGEAAVEGLGLTPSARLVAYATHSLHPDRFPEAPVGAIAAVAERAGIPLADIDLFEINEAFAAVPLIAIKELGLALEKVNVNGGAVALGHPVGASGARIVATLLAEMKRRQVRYGLASLCIGGGEAVAAIFERV